MGLFWTGRRNMTRERVTWSKLNDKEAWDELWKVQTPPKNKHLLWRIWRGCLPTRVRLRSHYV
jgi:hypothetical protein